MARTLSKAGEVGDDQKRSLVHDVNMTTTDTKGDASKGTKTDDEIQEDAGEPKVEDADVSIGKVNLNNTVFTTGNSVIEKDQSFISLPEGPSFINITGDGKQVVIQGMPSAN